MKKIYFLAVLSFIKLLIILIKIFKLGNASNFPGKIGLYINKDLLKEFQLSKNCKIILVTGTNGKSTTCGLVANFLKMAGHKVIYNTIGANLKSGVISTFSTYSDLIGNLKYDYILLEIDEATLHLITQDLTPSLISVTNLFRDQLDRFGELDTTAQLITKGINNQDTTVLLNADDPRVASLKTNNKKIYYGFSKDINLESSSSNRLKYEWLSDPEESTKCPKCKSKLAYSVKFLAHLGNYKCPNCNFKKPEVEFCLSNFKTDKLIVNFDILSSQLSQNKNNFFLPMVGIFNLYNALCAISIARLISDVTSVQIQKGLQSYTTLFGRGEKITIKNKAAWIYLIKNPTGTTEVLKTLVNDENARFLIALNDNYADGRDVSWIWDARFDYLTNHKKGIFVSGKRAYDIALRLKYANINQEKIKVNKNLKKSIYKAMDSLDKNETLYILPTYTALLELQRKKISK